MREPQPIIVADLFPELLEALLALLHDLSAADWGRDTVCSPWSVKDFALYLLGGDVQILSGRRDGHSYFVSDVSWEELVTYVNNQNTLWVQATARMSPQLLIDFLRLTGEQVSTYFQSLDPFSSGGPVSWVSPEPAPVWLDLAREYTERWHHQQHIRDAVGKLGLKQRRYLAPVIDAFCRALPRTFQNSSAVQGTLLALTVTGDSGGRWFLQREENGWRLFLEAAGEPLSEVVVDEDIVWRIFTRGLNKKAALEQVEIRGDQSLGAQVLDTVSVIA